MRAASSVLAVLALSALMGGCGAPNWARNGSGVMDGPYGVAVYGVGAGPAGLTRELQQRVARQDGRNRIHDETTAYANKLTGHLVQQRADLFRAEGIESLDFCAVVADEVASATVPLSRMQTCWADNRGLLGANGTLYVLMALPLDGRFFDLALGQYAALIGQHEEQLLTGNPDEALTQLEQELESVEQVPLEILSAPPVPEK